MEQKYCGEEELNTTNYVCEYYQHLMSEIEKLAVNAVILYNSNDIKQKEIIIKGESTPEKKLAVEKLLIDGQHKCRKLIKNRLIKEFPEIIFENSCKQCGKLPRTPKSKQCPYCYYCWSE